MHTHLMKVQLAAMALHYIKHEHLVHYNIHCVAHAASAHQSTAQIHDCRENRGCVHAGARD